MSSYPGDEQWAAEYEEANKQRRAIDELAKPGDYVTPAAWLDNPTCDKCHRKAHWFLARVNSLDTVCAECAA